MSYKCAVCGNEHDGPPWVWGPDAPLAWAGLPDLTKEDGELGTDQCVFTDGAEMRCFVRGRLEIPVIDHNELFAWLVWVEVQRDDFLDICEKWYQAGRESTMPYEGVLANRLPVYEKDTLGLQVKLITRPLGERPFVLTLTEHLLKQEQAEGIPEVRIEEIASLLSH